MGSISTLIYTSELILGLKQLYLDWSDVLLYSTYLMHVSVSFSFYFAIVKYNANYNNNNTLGRQSKKQYAYLKDCFKKWSKKLECKLSLAEHGGYFNCRHHNLLESS